MGSTEGEFERALVRTLQYHSLGFFFFSPRGGGFWLARTEDAARARNGKSEAL